MSTILIVEPHAVARDALEKLLTAEGFHVVAQPIAHVDAVLLDVDVRSPTAEETARELLRIYPGARILFMACERWTPIALEAPVLLKPIDLNALLRALRGDARPSSTDSSP